MSGGIMLPCRVELYCGVVDLRKGQNGLLGLVLQEGGKESANDVMYLFSNRNRDLVKGLFWDRTGYCVISKRLECGKFRIPAGERTIELDGQRLRLLLDGLNLFL